MPMQWNKAIVYPIPKPGDWELNLSKIRPITLLEIPRKILMKKDDILKAVKDHFNKVLNMTKNPSLN